MSNHPWLPYRFDPVAYPGVDLVVTYRIAGGTIDSMKLHLGDLVVPFTVDNGAAEVVVDSTILDSVPDGALAEVRGVTGGHEYIILRGYVTRAI